MPSMCLATSETDTDSYHNTTNSTNVSDSTVDPTANRTSIVSFVHYDVGIFLVKYLWPVIIFAGTVGNTLSFLVLIRRRMRRTSVYFYLAMLACADTCTLYLSGFKTWLRVLTGFELLHISNGSCKLLMFLFLQSLHLSAIFIVAVTIDRYLTIWFTFKNTALHVVKRAGTITLCAFCSLLFYNCHVFWTIGLQETEQKRLICAPFTENAFMCEIFPWLKLSLYTVVPFLIVFILNFAIVIKMFSVFYSLKKQTDESDDRNSQAQMGQYRITVMLLAVSFTWLILTAPFTLFIFVSEAADDPEQQAKQFLLKTVCFTLLYINHSINFYLYCVTGRKFRNELKEFLCSLHRRGHIFSKGHRTNLMRIGSNREQQQEQTFYLHNIYLK